MDTSKFPFPNQESQPAYAAAPEGSADKKDPFSRTAAADPNQSSVYPIPGVYPALMIDALKMIQSRNGDDLFIAEMEILKSQVEERPAGTRMSWIVNFKHDSAPGNVKAFFCSLLGVPEDQITADVLKYSCSAKNPCRGRLVQLEATNTKTKRGTDFTKCQWLLIPEEVQKQTAALRKNAGFDEGVPF